MKELTVRSHRPEIAAASAAVALPTVAKAADLVQQPVAKLAVVLCTCGLKAALRDEEARERIHLADRRFQQTLTGEQLKAWIAISDARTAAEIGEFHDLVRAVQRHSPELAVAMSLVAGHVVDANLDERGQCCSELWERFELTEV